MDTSNEQIGFVGVGLMGHGMAANIVAKGYPLHVIAHNHRAPVDDLVARGAIEVSSLAELAKRSTIIFICAPASPQVEEIVLALEPRLSVGSVIVDCSTSDPAYTEKLAARVAKRGVDFADAPLGGTPVQAEAGELQAMVGASESVFRRIEPVIAAWAGKIVHIGGVGDGHKMKLVNNFLSLGYAAIYSEAITLAAKSGLSPETFDSVIRGSRMDCGFYQTFMGHTIEGNRESHKFTISNAFKDLRYIAAMADNAQIANPVGSAIKNAFANAHAAGGAGPEDYVPHLVDFVARQNGVDLKPKT